MARLRLLILVPLLVVLAVATSPSRVGAEVPGELASIYHPLIAGSTWRYAVEEDDERYTQIIEVTESDAPGVFILATKSKLRRTRYYVSTDANRVILHKVDAKLAFLPFRRTKHFDPPLPFLCLAPDLTGEWSWQGHTRGYGPDLATAQYSLCTVGDEADNDVLPRLEIAATLTYRDGSREKFRAHYAAGVGLIDFRSETYTKTLIEHLVP